MSINIAPGTQVTFKPTISAEPVVGTYLGVVQPYEHQHHAILVEGFPEPNWVRVGSELEDSVKSV